MTGPYRPKLLATIFATGFRKIKENKKKVVDFSDFDNQ